MPIIDDFFLLLWGEDVKKLYSSGGDINNFLHTRLKSNHSQFCDYASIILIVSNSNIENIKEISEAKNALSFLLGLSEWDKKSVQFLQKELLFFLNSKGDTKLNKEIQQRFDKLRKESVIGYEKTRKLISLLALIKEKREDSKILHIAKSKDGSNFYESGVNLFHTSVENLRNAIEDKSLLVKMDKILEKLDSQKFSIGVTGVINAGKSTMLNALLGEEILGTSVVPETANLTIMKYSNTPRAKVNFWNTDEWEAIENSANSLKSMSAFVEETKDHFGLKLSEYITNESKSHEIKIDKLPSFTSAKYSDKKCNLIKSVELFSDLKFLKNGVEIVDTPGLDDPIIQREEITKNYVSRCDLMMHLMNVNQSATQKDIEFIVDTLLYQNVARLLIVITRVDSVKTNELNEVIAYTKSSLKKKLESLNKKNSLSSILEKNRFYTNFWT